MTQDFNSAFLDYARREIPLPPHDPQAIVGEMLRRDQWRTKLLAILSILFWLAGTSGMLVLIYGLNELVLYIRLHLSNALPTTQATSDNFREMIRGTGLIHHSLPWIAGSVIAFMLAALFTVMLVFSSRRATLTRINLSLMQMAEQLRLIGEISATK